MQPPAICQYHIKDNTMRQAVIAMAQLLGAEYRDSREIVAVLADTQKALDRLTRGVPAPAAVVEV